MSCCLYELKGLDVSDIVRCFRNGFEDGILSPSTLFADNQPSADVGSYPSCMPGTFSAATTQNADTVAPVPDQTWTGTGTGWVHQHQQWLDQAASPNNDSSHVDEHNSTFLAAHSEAGSFHLSPIRQPTEGNGVVDVTEGPAALRLQSSTVGLNDLLQVTNYTAANSPMPAVIADSQLPVHFVSAQNQAPQLPGKQLRYAICCNLVIIYAFTY